MNENMRDFFLHEKALKEGQNCIHLFSKSLNLQLKITPLEVIQPANFFKYLSMNTFNNLQNYIMHIPMIHLQTLDQKRNNNFANAVSQTYLSNIIFFFDDDEKNQSSDLFMNCMLMRNSTQLYNEVLIHYNHLQNPIQVYKLITADNQEIKFQINKANYSADQKLNEIFQKFLKNQNIQKQFCENNVERASIFEYFYQFAGYIDFILLSLYKEFNTSWVYSLFDIFSKQLLYVTKKRKVSAYKILSNQGNCFNLISIYPNNLQFNELQSTSLLIHTLTKIYPCKQTEVNLFHLLKPQEQSKFQISEENQIILLQGYRKLLSMIVEAWRDSNKQNRTGLQNIFRLSINYFFNNCDTSFSLTKESTLQTYLQNLVICDRNFITLLSIFLMDFGSQEAYEDLLRTSNLAPEQFRQVLLSLLKRTLLSNIVLLKCGIPKLYKGQAKLYKEEMKPKEVSLEQDVAYIQLYAFLFGSLGINDIVSSYKEIAKFFDYKSDPQFLICRIAQTDYDLIQCVGDIFGNEFQKAQTIYSKQSSSLKLLKKFSYDSSWDLLNIILVSCELNKDHEQLQLERSLQPVQYEPIFASLVLVLKEQITEKLKTQNDKQSELFGTALANELSQINEHKSTLTYKRLAILKAIVLDQEQQVNRSWDQFKIFLKYWRIILSTLTQFVYVQTFQKHKQTLQEYWSSIFSICLQIIQDVNLTQTQYTIYEIFARQLGETFSLNSSQVENDAQRACKSQLLKRERSRINLKIWDQHQVIKLQKFHMK
ncbi:unnamed protein product [Paramecium octaurelia]|uniref:Uncharacterized protein n=1 Tax=Paramecium octaurelia TaxID=43137 RepID=A0A8S1YQ28_PAROT|nr:unnamed protein product [Paramecium octaurelia]